MTTDHAGIKRLFLAVCDQPDAAAQRAALAALGADADAVASVLQLLGHDALPTRFSTPLAQAAEALQQGELRPGDRLGSWTLGEELGHGGMGRVHLAERSDRHYRQRAAVKLLLGWSGAEGLARLARERQILASLNHPHIARLLDGGSTPSGRPYLVMEFSDGQAIDQHASQHALDLDARLRLFTDVCDAVAYAHRQLVIHCDIKPSNVFVTAEGHVLLLDFGIAQLQGEGDQTSAAAAMTPDYASPEQQAGGRPATGWDVFGLGRLLQTLCAPLASRHRRERELQALIARATAADPDQRYASVTDLTADVQRLRKHLPLRALPATPSYLLAKQLRRRWPWALAAGAALAGSAAFTVQLVQQRDLARQEAATAMAVSNFVGSLFEGADPQVGGRHDVTAIELIDRGRERLAQDLQTEPALRSRLLEVLADVYERLGRTDTAAAVFKDVLALGAEPMRERRLQGRLALLLSNHYQAAQAEAPARRALLLAQQHQTGDAEAMIDAENRLAVVLTALGRLDEAEPLLQSALARGRAWQGAHFMGSGSVLTNLARLQIARGQLDAAESSFRTAIEAQLATRGADHNLTLNTRTQLANMLARQRRFDEALPMLAAVVQDHVRIWGPQSPLLALALNAQGVAMLEAGLAADAVAVQARATEIRRLRAAGEPRDLAISLHNLGRALTAHGDAAAAESALRESVELRVKAWPAGSPNLYPARESLLRLLLMQGRGAEALALADALWQAREPLAARDEDRRLALLLRAEAWIQTGQFATARGALAPLENAAPKLIARQAVMLARLQALLADAAEGGDARVAALHAWRQAWALQAAALPPGHPLLLAPGLQASAGLRRAGQPGEARALLQALKPAAEAQVAASPWRRSWAAAVAN